MVEQGGSFSPQCPKQDPIVVDPDYLESVFPGFEADTHRVFLQAGIDPVLLSFPPAIHIYEGGITSGAFYLVDGEVREEHVVYVSFIPPNSKTSQHAHPGFEEEYYPVAGRLHVMMNGREEKIEGPFAVRPGVRHQGVTHEAPALTVLVMRNAARVPKEERHVR